MLYVFNLVAQELDAIFLIMHAYTLRRKTATNLRSKKNSFMSMSDKMANIQLEVAPSLT